MRTKNDEYDKEYKNCHSIMTAAKIDKELYIYYMSSKYEDNLQRIINNYVNISSIQAKKYLYNFYIKSLPKIQALKQECNIKLFLENILVNEIITDSISNQIKDRIKKFVFEKLTKQDGNVRLFLLSQNMLDYIYDKFFLFEAETYLYNSFSLKTIKKYTRIFRILYGKNYEQKLFVLAHQKEYGVKALYKKEGISTKIRSFINRTKYNIFRDRLLYLIIRIICTILFFILFVLLLVPKYL